MINLFMRRFFYSLPLIFAAMAMSCGRMAADANHDTADIARCALSDSLRSLVAGAPGEVGIAVIFDGRDTISIGNDVRYPLMSVFKLHEALAVCHELDSRDAGLDTVLHISRGELADDTWSPMLNRYPEGDIDVTVGELIDNILIDSDNNASNVLFERICPVSRTDSFVRSLGIEDSFKLVVMESDMQREHDKAYLNWSSPRACAGLVDKVFHDSVVSADKQQHIIRAMKACDTGKARLSAGLAGSRGVTFAHRTGSGYTNERGEVVAVNDIGYVALPDGRGYSIAVLVKDYAGMQEDAEHLMARISAVVHNHFSSVK